MTKVIAHRGARSLAPENTLKAARIAFESGADLWETDVTLTRDKKCVLFHDPILTRCTDVLTRYPERSPWQVRDFTLEEIRSLDAGSWFITTDPFNTVADGRVSRERRVSFRGEPVPTLEEGLELTRECRWKINLELKFQPGMDSILPDRVLASIRRLRMTAGQVVISSFDHPWLEYILKKAPDLEVQALVGGRAATALDFGGFFFSVYNADADRISRDDIKELKNRGKKINLFTVNDPDAFARFSALGVDGIFTDFPQEFASPRTRVRI